MTELAREIFYGIGLEGTYGVPSPAAYTFNQLSFELNPIAEIVNNESAWGNQVRTNTSSVLRRHAEGSLEAKFTPILGSFILAGVMGKVSTTTNPDASGRVYNHTLDLASAADASDRSFTLYRKGLAGTQAYPGCRVGEWSLQADLDDYIRYSANIMGMPATTSTYTPAQIEESEFLPSHLGIRKATNIASLSAADNLSLVSSFNITANPNLEADPQFGSKTPKGFSNRGYELSFEMTCRYDDTTYEDAYNNGTHTSWQVRLIDEDTTIGNAAHPKLLLTAPRVTITDWTRDEGDLNAPISQTMTGTIHYSPQELYALRAVATNTLATLF